MARTEAGCDLSGLSELRPRLIAGGAAERLLPPILALFVGRGLRKARGNQRPDATHIVAAVRALQRWAIGGDTLHPALNVLAPEAPDGFQGPGTAEGLLR